MPKINLIKSEQQPYIQMNDICVIIEFSSGFRMKVNLCNCLIERYILKTITSKCSDSNLLSSEDMR